ncbi:MAG: 3-isopropylmalate dehydratase large subunit [Sutterella sp.]|nr:3-isopropylmalate dehydratase large subunit [Sutterella sp.]
MGKTLYEKVFDAHVVREVEGEQPLIYIDRHLVHEVTSPQAFEGLREANRPLRRPELILSTVDHDISTQKASLEACSDIAKKQVTTLMNNVKTFGVRFYGLGDTNQGIVHIIGPESGFTLPGTTLVCGDSHTATHGAFGALAFGIGTSEVEHVMATQTLGQARLKTMRITCEGELPEGVFAKDLILEIARVLTTAGATGYAIEFAGSGVKALSMQGRMTLSNMAIEIGAKVGMIAPDEKTFEFLKDTPLAPKGNDWEKAVAYWKTLCSDKDAVFDKEIVIDSAHLVPVVTWGTNPGQGIRIDQVVPDPEVINDDASRSAVKAALEYTKLKAGESLLGTPVNVVFIGSCTNGRLEDFQEAAKVLKGKKVAQGVRALAVPGSARVKAQAEAMGIDQIFKEAGFEWRLPGCSMCLGMNDDLAGVGDRVASTSNRNFIGRQGRGSITHLMSPAMAAAAAVAGKICDVRELIQ